MRWRNNLRALTAYEEALKVRNPQDTPLEYANTISNKANALRNLPDDPEHPEGGNDNNLKQARAFYLEAVEIFQRFGEHTKVHMTNEVVAELDKELGNNDGFPHSEPTQHNSL